MAKCTWLRPEIKKLSMHSAPTSKVRFNHRAHQPFCILCSNLFETNTPLIVLQFTVDKLWSIGNGRLHTPSEAAFNRLLGVVTSHQSVHSRRSDEHPDPRANLISVSITTSPPAEMVLPRCTRSSSRLCRVWCGWHLVQRLVQEPRTSLRCTHSLRNLSP